MHETPRNLNQSWHEAAKPRPQRDAAHYKESNISQVDRGAGLAAESEWPTRYNNRSLQPQRMLAAECDRKVNGHGVDPLASQI
jgi:hypothetical protein